MAWNSRSILFANFAVGKDVPENVEVLEVNNEFLPGTITITTPCGRVFIMGGEMQINEQVRIDTNIYEYLEHSDSVE